jgi:hypothetical protein
MKIQMPKTISHWIRYVIVLPIIIATSLLGLLFAFIRTLCVLIEESLRYAHRALMRFDKPFVMWRDKNYQADVK